MRVRATATKNLNGWFLGGKIYPVIEIYVPGGGKKSMFRIPSEMGSPVLHAIDDFEIVDPALSDEWAVDFEDDAITLAPAAFLRPGFWVDFFDDHPEAISTYIEIMKKLN